MHHLSLLFYMHVIFTTCAGLLHSHGTFRNHKANPRQNKDDKFCVIWTAQLRGSPPAEALTGECKLLQLESLLTDILPTLHGRYPPSKAEMNGQHELFQTAANWRTLTYMRLMLQHDNSRQKKSTKELRFGVAVSTISVCNMHGCMHASASEVSTLLLKS